MEVKKKDKTTQGYKVTPNLYYFNTKFTRTLNFSLKQGPTLYLGEFILWMAGGHTIYRLHQLVTSHVYENNLFEFKFKPF